MATDGELTASSRILDSKLTGISKLGIWLTFNLLECGYFWKLQR